MAGTQLSSSLEEELAAIYGGQSGSDDGLMVTRVPAQQQQGGVDCGLFSVAFAFHAAHGDDVGKLCLDQSMMRHHLLDCFEQQELSPFPEIAGKTRRCRTKHFFISLHCICGMPESVDKKMVECEECKKWFHYKCVGLTEDPDTWRCNQCNA